MSEKWHNRLKSFVPFWFYSQGGRNQDVVLRAMAAALDAMEENISDHTAITFIKNATGDILDLIARGRDVPFIEGEFISLYRARIRNVTNSGNCPAIKEFVDAALINGESRVLEGLDITSFLERDTFVNRNIVLNSSNVRNSFFVSVPHQRPPLGAFLNRSDFLGEDFISANEIDENLFVNLTKIINSEKAFGVLWEFRERAA